VRGVNDLKPDIVCIAGDIFNDDYGAIRNPDRAITLLKSIEATYGVYACLGNHDAGKTLGEMMSFLEQSDIKLLNDEYVIINEQLVLFGRLDPSPIGGFGELKRKDTAEILEAAASLDENLLVVVMEHNPATVKEYGGEVDLILAAHTHRGQIFPGSLITRAMFSVDYGYSQGGADSPGVIVTQGVNTWGAPMRVGTNNEIVSILLKPGVSR
jgi:predicted MPP superfamily phosphohydrolase